MNRRTCFVVVLFMLCFLCSSCSSLNFVASGKTPFNISSLKNSDHEVEFSGSSDFYFWGHSPGITRIDLEDLEGKLGLVEPAYVVVEQKTSWEQIFYTVITLGLYSPIDYKIRILSAKGQIQ